MRNVQNKQKHEVKKELHIKIDIKIQFKAMTKITRSVRNKDASPKRKKSYDATNYAVRHYTTKITFLLFKPSTNPMRWMCNSIPYMQHQIWYVYSIYADRHRRSCLLSYMYKCEHFRKRKS